MYSYHTQHMLLMSQYFAKISLPLSLFNVFPPSFSLSGLLQHGDPSHHPHHRSGRLSQIMSRKLKIALRAMLAGTRGNSVSAEMLLKQLGRVHQVNFQMDTDVQV